MESIPRKLILTSILFLLVLTTGTLGYMLIEKWNFLDSLYMTVITLTTVGYGEIHPLSTRGRIFSIFLILLGMGILAYIVQSWLTFFIEGHIGGMLKKRKMNKLIQQLKNHYIICGAGEIAVYVIEEFYKTKSSFIVVSLDDSHVLPWVKSKGDILYLAENPEEDEVLETAGIKHAIGLISVLDDDKRNLFTVLTARQLNPKIKIISQAIERNCVPKLTKAGADIVVSATEIGGMRIASSMLRPSVVNFLDRMLYVEDKPLRIEEQIVPENSHFVGKSLQECEIPQKTGLLIVAVKENSTGNYIYNPSANYILQPNDVLIVIGDTEQIRKLSFLIKNG